MSYTLGYSGWLLSISLGITIALSSVFAGKWIFIYASKAFSISTSCNVVISISGPLLNNGRALFSESATIYSNA